MDTMAASRTPDEMLPSQAPRGRRRWRVIAVATACVVALVGAAWWLTHPNKMQPFDSSSELPLQVGQAVVVGMFAQPLEGSVRVTGVTGNVRENTADAELRVLLCETPVGRPKVGSDFGRAEDVCAAVSSPVGHDLAAKQQQYLVLEVVPRRSGTVVVDGLRVSYRDGWRRGTEVSGLSASFSVGSSLVTDPERE